MSTRKVHRCGWIKHEGEMIFVSQALGGWEVGLCTRADGDLEVYFARLLLGHRTIAVWLDALSAVRFPLRR